jgi:hypothetical protein
MLERVCARDSMRLFLGPGIEPLDPGRRRWQRGRFVVEIDTALAVRGHGADFQAIEPQLGQLPAGRGFIHIDEGHLLDAESIGQTALRARLLSGRGLSLVNVLVIGFIKGTCGPAEVGQTGLGSRAIARPPAAGLARQLRRSFWASRRPQIRLAGVFDSINDGLFRLGIPSVTPEMDHQDQSWRLCSYAPNFVGRSGRESLI